MKGFIAPLISLCLGCSSRIHPSAKYTNYTLDYHRYIANDSVQLHFISPADIDYSETNRGLKSALRKSDLKSEKNILIYGISEFPPYEYVVTVSDLPQATHSESYIIFDTVIKGQYICFKGNPLVEDAKRSLEIDLKNMVLSLNKLGE